MRGTPPPHLPPSARPRQLPITPDHKLSPEWSVVTQLLSNDSSRDQLLAGATVTQVMRGARMAPTHYIGALEVVAAPGARGHAHRRAGGRAGGRAADAIMRVRARPSAAAPVRDEHGPPGRTT